MKFCSNCAEPVSLKIPVGDNRLRYVCDACLSVHYENPRVVVGCVPEYQGKILLCKRAIEPRLGFWTVPAGFLENGETLEDGAARECFEEACARVEILSLLAIVNVTYAHQVHVLYRARMLSADHGISSESLEVKLVPPAEIPWQDIAFRSVELGLKNYLNDRSSGSEHVHSHALYPVESSSR